MTENPYKAGSPCYLAWEFGYMQALDDVKELDNVQDKEKEDESTKQNDARRS